SMIGKKIGKKTLGHTKLAESDNNGNKRRRFDLLIILLGLLFLIDPGVRADELRLNDGRVIEAEEIWLIGDTIWYRQGKIITSIPNTAVSRISRPQTATTAGATITEPTARASAFTSTV